MSALARPSVLAILLGASAFVLHPAARAATWLPERDLLLAALFLSTAIGVASRALRAPSESRVGAWLAGVGCVLAIGALALDGLRGRHGTLALGVGQGRSHFEELGPSGRALGLRPLGFTLGVERVTAAGDVALAVPGQSVATVLERGRTVAIGGFRFAHPRVTVTGEAALLRVGVTDGRRSWSADVAPGRPGQAGDLTISLEGYFPDFALDADQQPFTRSLEPRNPAALLGVEHGGQRYRAFVIQSMPGVHRIEPLGLSFGLLEVEPERSVEIAVHREPSAIALLVAGLLVAAGISFGSVQGRAAAVPVRLEGPLLAGTALAAALLLADGGHVLGWSFGVATSDGRTVLPAVGVFLGVSLLASLAGVLLLAAHDVAPGSDARALARVALWLAVSAGALGSALALVRVALLSESNVLTALPSAGTALAVGLLATALVRRGPKAAAPDAAGRSDTQQPEPDAVARLVPACAAVVVTGALAAGIVGMRTDGTYATPAVAAAAATALAGLCALEATGVPGLRRLAFLVASLALLVRPW